MRQLHILLFITSGSFTFPFIVACVLSATAAGLAVWFICNNTKKKEAAKSETAKKKLEFLTYLTNELRTPVTLITTPLQKLAGNSFDKKIDKELETMQQNAEKVLSILDKTMSIDKIDEDDKTMRFREIDLVKYVHNLLLIFKYEAKLGNVELGFHSDKDSIVAWLDRNRFDGVLITLIDTILKATQAGNKLDIAVADDGKSATIAFNCNGIIIADKRIPQLFELLQRSDSGAVTGTNIDLYLCKDIVNKHKGDIIVKNSPGGLTCTIRLPLGNKHIPKERLSDKNDKLDETWRLVKSSDISCADSEVPASGRKYSVIAIDEYPAICQYLQKMLSPLFNITTYTNPEEGLNSAIADTPDLIIAEVMMSNIDGISLVKRLKSNANTSHVPVLLLTALPGIEVRVQSLLIGADAIISKPFNEEELILTCNNLIINRSRIASHIKGMQITKDTLHPIELQNNNDALMQRVLEVINEHVSDSSLNVETLADAIGISRGHLHRKIKEITGSSPGEYIRAIRLNQAAQLLKGDKKNIAQIAYSVGYNNPSVFSTAFKSFVGISAKEYQKRFAKSAAE